MGGGRKILNWEAKIEAVLIFTSCCKWLAPKDFALAFHANSSRNSGRHGVANGDAPAELFLSESGFRDVRLGDREVGRGNFTAQADGEESDAGRFQGSGEVFGRTFGVVLAIGEEDDGGAWGKGGEGGFEGSIEVGGGGIRGDWELRGDGAGGVLAALPTPPEALRG